MEFPAKIRKVGKNSLMITIPTEVVEKLSIQEGDIRNFTLKEDEKNDT